MITAEHRRPLAALVLVFAAACMIVSNGLRTHVVEVLIDAGAPRELVIAIAPDMVLGYTLNNAPPSPQTPQVAPKVSSAADSSPVDLDFESGTASVAQTPREGGTRPAANPRPRQPQTPVGGPVAPGEVVTPVPTPDPKPEPTPLPSPRPGLLPLPIELPLGLLPGKGLADRGHHWNSGNQGHDRSRDGRGDEGRGDRNPWDRGRGERGEDRGDDASNWGHDRRDHDGREDRRDYDRGDRDRGRDGDRGRDSSNQGSSDRDHSEPRAHHSRSDDRNESRGHHSRGDDRNGSRGHHSRGDDRGDRGRSGRGH